MFNGKNEIFVKRANWKKLISYKYDYHFDLKNTANSAGIDDIFVVDYAVIFVLEYEKICFEKFDIWEDNFEISKVSFDENFNFIDNSGYFDDDELYETNKVRVIHSL